MCVCPMRPSLPSRRNSLTALPTYNMTIPLQLETMSNAARHTHWCWPFIDLKSRNGTSLKSPDCIVSDPHSFFRYCKSEVANGKTGSTIYVVARSVYGCSATRAAYRQGCPPFTKCHE